MTKTKHIDSYAFGGGLTLEYSKERVYVFRTHDHEHVGSVELFVDEPATQDHSHYPFTVPLSVWQAAAEFLKACLAEEERERARSVTAQVTYYFCFAEGPRGPKTRVAVFTSPDDVEPHAIGYVSEKTAGRAIPEPVVAAARKFAGWA